MAKGLVLNGRFRLLEELGRGGMGSVWRAEDMALEAEAAVKLIDPSLLQTPEALARFKREAKAAAAIRSTHVVQILEYGIQQGSDNESQPYIAMELLKGESLAKRLQTVGKLAPDLTLSVLTHVARALSLAHASGIVHRDLKPDNVFLVREMDDDVGKVLDFGIARQLGAVAKTGGLQTQSGAVLGTPYYMSPEQTIGQAVDARSDIWSFGVMAFECLTGARPFEQETLGGLFHAICVADLPVPSQRGGVPQGFDDWFARATARDANARFQSIEEAITQLRRCCGSVSGRSLSAVSRVQSPEPIVPARTGKFGFTPPPASQTIAGVAPARPWLMFAVGLPILVVIFIGGYFGWKKLQSEASPPLPASSLVLEHLAPTALASDVVPVPPMQPAVVPVVSPAKTASTPVTVAPAEPPLARPIQGLPKASPSEKSTPKGQVAGKAVNLEKNSSTLSKTTTANTAPAVPAAAEKKPLQTPAAPPPVKRKENVAGF